MRDGECDWTSLEGSWRARVLAGTGSLPAGAEVRHPFDQVTMAAPPRPASLILEEALAALDAAAGSAAPRARFLATWRRIPALAADAGLVWAPAGPDLPDASLWAAADLAAARAAAPQAALMSITLGPVQSFIAAARSLRDLWTGSVLLSWLAFQALGPILERLGPTAVISPALRGNPLMDLWLARQGIALDGQSPGRGLPPCLPHRLTALVPWDQAAALCRDCEQAARAALEQEVGAAVRAEIDSQLGAQHPHWDSAWDAQMRWMLSVRALATPWQPGEDWLAAQDRLGRLAEAAKLPRPIPTPDPARPGREAPKCSLTGDWEQIGGERFQRAAVAKLRLKGVRLRRGETFCAPSLVKRFAFPAALREQLDLERADGSFPDTAQVAAAAWLQQTEVRAALGGTPLNGQWLFWDRPDRDADEEPCPAETWAKIRAARAAAGPPPRYYALLMADGDRMGEWLRGERGSNASPPTPERLATFSAVLADFASRVAPPIIARHHGRLIYSGGDDVMAALPLRTALAAASALRAGFTGRTAGHAGWAPGSSGDVLALGETAGLSVGVAIVHTKHDLRQARAEAEKAEKAAKKAGRDRACLTLLKRSGGPGTVILGWEDVPWMDALVAAFDAGASDRWIHKLRDLAPILATLPEAAVRCELKRQWDRIERAQRAALERELTRVSGQGEPLDAWFDHLGGTTGPGPALTALLDQAQAASFIARGHED